MYETDQKTSELFRYFTFLAVFISCLGLFGMVSYITELRTKEIGIRKVLGASLTNLFVLLVREYLLILVISIIIGWPFAYYAVKRILSNYAYATDISLLLFAVAGIMILLIALLTMTSQILRSARSNPVDSLRYE